MEMTRCKSPKQVFSEHKNGNWYRKNKSWRLTLNLYLFKKLINLTNYNKICFMRKFSFVQNNLTVILNLQKNSSFRTFISGLCHFMVLYIVLMMALPSLKNMNYLKFILWEKKCTCEKCTNSYEVNISTIIVKF